MLLCGIIIEIQNVAERPTASEFLSSPDILASFSKVNNTLTSSTKSGGSDWFSVQAWPVQGLTLTGAK